MHGTAQNCPIPFATNILSTSAAASGRPLPQSVTQPAVTGSRRMEVELPCDLYRLAKLKASETTESPINTVVEPVVAHYPLARASTSFPLRACVRVMKIVNVRPCRLGIMPP